MKKMEDKYKTEIERGEVVWKDKRALVWAGLILSSFFFLLSSYFFIYSKPLNQNYRILLLPVVLLSLFFLYSQIRKRTIFITSEGIRVGNLTYWADDKLILKQKPTFIEWSKIKNINIFKKSYRQGVYGGRDFCHIHLKTKSGKIYECLVYNPNGFIQSLKKINKYQLLSKETKEKYK